MKRFGFILSFVIVAIGCVGQARWTEMKHDFGVINEDDGPVTCNFVVVNDGVEPMTIISARATCGCTRPLYPVKAIAPGDSAKVSVTYDPQMRPGRFNKPVYVETSTASGKVRLDISGVVIGSESTIARRFPMDCGPLKLAHNGIMLGEIFKGRFKTVYTEGYNRSDDSLRIKIIAKPSFVDVVAAPEVAPPGEQVTLVAYVNSDKCPLYGLVEDLITISPVPGMEYTMPVTMLVKEDFSQMSSSDMQRAPRAMADSESIDFGTIDRAGASVSRTFKLSNLGKNKLEIRRVYSSDLGITATVNDKSIKSGKSTEITVTVDPTVQTGALLNSQLTIITNDPLRPVFTIRVVGTY